MCIITINNIKLPFNIFKNSKDWNIPILFGIGRAGLELFYNLVIIALGSYNISTMLILIIARVLMFGGGIGLTIMDYVSARVTKTKTLCFLAIIFHAIMNGVLYAIEINYIQTIENFDSFFMIVMASIIILISSFIYKNNKVKSKV
ncbi:hypothetical protein [Romboutsia sp.]|uniref:hypothetical protein n=1 Tax=Romboutsia sp. TaxID=1965302 RepID=UPI003F67F414